MQFSWPPDVPFCGRRSYNLSCGGPLCSSLLRPSPLSPLAALLVTAAGAAGPFLPSGPIAGAGLGYIVIAGGYYFGGLVLADLPATCCADVTPAVHCHAKARCYRNFDEMPC